MAKQPLVGQGLLLVEASRSQCYQQNVNSSRNLLLEIHLHCVKNLTNLYKFILIHAYFCGGVVVTSNWLFLSCLNLYLLVVTTRRQASRKHLITDL
jgi:hypothetical protein